MTSEEFVEEIYRWNTGDLSWIGRVKSVHSWFILEGLKRKFADASRQIDASSSLGDAILLYLLIRHYNVREAVEIGTWFGAGAGVMALAIRENGGGTVYTCDKNNCYVNDSEFYPMIRYFNESSTDMLRNLGKNNKKIGFCFVDGRLNKGDAERIISLYDGPVLYTNHDYGLEKCKANIAAIKKVYKNADVLYPRVPWYADSEYREEYMKVETDPFKITCNTVVVI